MIQFAANPFNDIRWQDVPEETTPGQVGHAAIRSVEHNHIRVRLVRYSPNYESDHWCDRGHILHVLDGHLTIKLKDGRAIELGVGSSAILGEGVDPHAAASKPGASVFIVDAAP